jgi:hypothetical protein
MVFPQVTDAGSSGVNLVPAKEGQELDDGFAIVHCPPVLEDHAQISSKHSSVKATLADVAMGLSHLPSGQ